MSTGNANPRVTMFIVAHRPRIFFEATFVTSGTLQIADRTALDEEIDIFERGILVGAASFGKQVQVYFSHKPEHWPEDEHLRSRIVEQFDEIKKQLQAKLETTHANEPDAVPETEGGRHPD